MPFRWQLPFLLFLLSWHVTASGQSVDPKECGTCHETQYQTWTEAKHNTRGVQCAVCHGDFHSGTLSGCTGCHTGEHNLKYKEWQFVKDYMVEGDTSDYYCIVCHDPHNPKKAKVLLCNSCHGSTAREPQPRKGFRAGLQSAHNAFARIAPNMDEAAWNQRVKSKSGKLLMGAGAALMVILLLFPYAFTGFFIARWMVRKIRRRRS